MLVTPAGGFTNLSDGTLTGGSYDDVALDTGGPIVTDTFVGRSGIDYVYAGAGRSFTSAGSGTDVVTTGAGNDYVKAGTGALVFNDTAANIHAGRFDLIDGFAGARSADLYLPRGVQGATSFVSQNGGTAIVTAVGGGSAELFVSGASLASVQAHTHFTL